MCGPVGDVRRTAQIKLLGSAGQSFGDVGNFGINDRTEDHDPATSRGWLGRVRGNLGRELSCCLCPRCGLARWHGLCAGW